MAVSDVHLDLQQTLSLYQVSADDIEFIQQYAKQAFALIDTFLDAFYDWMPNVPQYKRLFAKEAQLQRVKSQQGIYWHEFFECKIDQAYLDSRFKVGLTHAKIDLPIDSYSSAVSFGLSWWTNQVNHSKLSEAEKAKTTTAINKLIMLDTGVTCAAYSTETNRLIEAQSRTLMELSTPSIQLWDEIMVLPIVGVLDSQRVQGLMDEMLNKIALKSAKVSIIDIVGVPSIDSSVANHLIKIVTATRLLGCTSILSGISPEIAQTLVQLGVDLSIVETTANLQNALRLGLNMVHLEITKQ